MGAFFDKYCMFNGLNIRARVHILVYTKFYLGMCAIICLMGINMPVVYAYTLSDYTLTIASIDSRTLLITLP